MKPCARCSRPERQRTVYHVGECPKTLAFEIPFTMDNWFMGVDYGQTLDRWRNQVMLDYAHWVEKVTKI